MPKGRSAPAPDAPPKSKRLVALIYAHVDHLTPKSWIISFVRAAARDEDYVFWWDYYLNSPNFTQEILSRLKKADLVVCFLSQGFFDSQYIADIELEAIKTRIGKGLLVVPVKYRRYASDSTHHGWLSELHQVPRDKFIYGADQQLFLYKQVAEHIKKLLRDKKAPFAAHEALYAIRHLPNESFSAMEQDRLREDAKKRAQHYLPDQKLRRQICEEAKALGASLRNPLSKPQLAMLDAKFLAHTEKRNPDPKKVRWVLRAAGLHPQGRAPKGPPRD